MECETQSNRRRTLLQRGLVAAAAALGLATGNRRASASAERGPAPEAPPLVAGRPLRWYGRGRTVFTGGKGAGSRSLRRLELLDRPDGAPIGEFFASGFQFETAFGPLPGAPSNVELHTFRLGEDTLFGIGAPSPRGRERTHAVLGGTGRFAGARGSYVERDVEGGAPGRGRVEFVVTLVG
jgi:hypothetical protein